MVVNAFVQSLHALLIKFGINAPDIRVHGMTLDSREVTPKLVFVAVKGHANDGRDFIPQAISLGARAVLAEADEAGEHGQILMREQTVIVKVWELSALLSSLAAAFYDYPANKLATIAVTGTNGKTSVVQLISQMKHLLGHRAASIGTLGSGIYRDEQNSKPPANGNTTPDAISMQYLLAEFVQQEVNQVAYEASSHALVQNRLKQVNTEIAVFTNLTRDHLDYHGTMEAYAEAKLGLLELPGLHSVVLNYNDEASKAWALKARPSVQKVWTAVVPEPVQNLPEGRYCFATNVQYHANGCQFRLATSWGTTVVQTELLGHFNIANLMSATAALLSQGERFDNVVKTIEQVHAVAGRLEVFEFNQHANVVVDYAHTPDALTQALKALRLHTQGKLWCVFGCGGDRDKGKRPLMAKAAEQDADVLIITTDNSRSESPEAIAADIRAGLAKPELARDIPDREQAIRYCLEQAGPDDLILAAGKGHESYQIIGNKKINYNEREVIARLQQECSK
ncbi:UDP-N-acetylmuramoyl-L-alanyl-D-glutamate--2,6-diaminopimelate ligase [Alteromonas lipolytica]|uniref:UDP-N-acetylmuramyl-tripeptide synthetase n=1 Tax=Alteromonas lipolytica TaxID=1856405 RepID=A0A1E8F9P4_9ALTE|nr:UDP-N-acetylmuramoyl-L-alanyl-D-glutamate--2,6-diaminopimelate ligase [Alteromonas lipolytica]OFI32637.1 UDP-N-acetylmuramoyl-L-alanyl-D-glutamate--2,6-diaminopimelate ligase [Alteromonas lipolytica]GGF74486.1 UDP-N-acetylmuramoyl-L-alanyl-D-glutamate--2,6-diaminopimelate ligase [Alteromonas lipolytica]